jgi:tRNA (Thr-GGU) A37 N-methylase
LKEAGHSDRFKNEEMIIKPIGYVRSKLKTPSLQAKWADLELKKGPQQAAMEAKNIRSLVSELVINPELEANLHGLEDFSHALVPYWPHLLPHHGRSLTKVHPIGQKQFPLLGVFSTCSPARPT